MAIAVRQKTPNSTTPGGGYPLSSLAITAFGSNVLAASAIVVPVSRWHDISSGDWNDDNTPTVMFTDSVGRTYTNFHTSGTAGDGDTSCGIGWLVNAAADSGSPTVVTINAGNSDNAYHAHAVELTGVATTDALRTSATNIGVSNAPSVTVNGVENGDIIIANVAVTGANDASIDLPTDFIALGDIQSASSTVGYYAAYRIMGSSGNVTVAWGTLASSMDWEACAIVLKAAEGGGGGATVHVPPLPQRNRRYSGRYMREAFGLLLPRPRILLPA